MTVISGDRIQIIETTGDWHRGRNLATLVAGTFPAVCGILIDAPDVSQTSLLAHPQDLLYYETSLTLSVAINMFLDTKTWPETLKLADRLFDVMAQLVLCQGDAGQVAAAHSTLSSCVDNLRSSIGLTKQDRNSYNTISTLSTWGRQLVTLSKESDSRSKALEYVILHLFVEVQMKKKQRICRFFLWDGLQHRFISVPASMVANKGSQFSLVYDELEMRQVTTEKVEGKPDHLWLVIYTYDLRVHREGQFDERKFVSCAVCKLPKAKAKSDRKQSKYFGKCRVYDVQSMTSSNKTILSSLHTVLANVEIPPPHDKTLVRHGPTFSVRFTPFFGATDDVVRGQKLRTPQIIPPVQLPVQFSPRLKRSLFTITLRNL
jgi:hypothetical protein